MLSRLLKYDFRAILKYWWLAAVTSVGLAAIGGVCAVILDNNFVQQIAFKTIAGLGLFLSILGMVAFTILSEILIYVRFYRHFFTDEGYLTFTLPVKRSDLLTSKLVSAMTVSVMTGIVVALDIGIIIAFLMGDRLFDAQMWERRLEMIRELWDVLGGYMILYILQVLLLMLVLTVLSIMLMYCCITVAGIVVKKHKVLAAIGICYAASGVVSFVSQWVLLFGIYGVGAWFSPLSEAALKGVIALVLAVFILFVAAISVGLYVLNLWMIDRRLNLS